MRHLSGSNSAAGIVLLFFFVVTLQVGSTVVSADKPAAIVDRAAEPDAVFDEAAIEFFEKKVRPILVARCYECHSDKTPEPSGGLRLDSRAAVLAGGETGPAVKPGKLKNSLLIDAIDTQELYEMPPKGRLPVDEIAVLKQWVERGAPWPVEVASKTVDGSSTAAAVTKKFDLAQRKQQHWAWQPIQSPAVPVVKNSDWASDPIDRFVLQKLEAAALSPAAAADKRVLIRRAYFDLTGLPPTAQQISAYLNDSSPQSFEKIVDELLASPHFGERWARHWMDVVRYAETRGHEFDPLIPNAWQYRDYLIRAFNADVPFDQFLTEHLAGDLLDKPRVHPTHGWNESILGTGFWFLGEEVHSPVDIRQDETDRIDNRLDTMSKAFLGVTVACARCHDHKFDAISQKDYYALAGFITSGTYRQVRFETQLAEQQAAANWRDHQRDTGPKLLAHLLAAQRPTIDHFANYLLAARDVMLHNIHEKNVDRNNQTAFMEKLCSERTLQRRAVQRLIDELVIAKKDQQHPLHVFAIVAGQANADQSVDQTVEFAKAIEPLRERFRQALQRAKTVETSAAAAERQVVIDYRTAPAEHWLTNGIGFGLSPVRAGDLVLSPEMPAKLLAATSPLRVVRYDAAERTLVWPDQKNAGSERDHGALEKWDRSAATLRTPRVTLRSGKLWYLVRGGGRAYVSVDSHLVIAGPLHGALVKEWDLKPGEWKWVGHDLSTYAGHRAHVEFSPKGSASDKIASGDLAIRMVVDSINEPPQPVEVNQLVVDAISAPRVQSIDTLANAYQDLFTNVSSLANSGTPPPESEVSDRAALLDWLAAQHETFVSPDTAAAKKLADALDDSAKVLADIRAKVPAASHTAPVMFEGNGVDEPLLIRGSSKTPTDLVPRRLLEAIGGAHSNGYGRGSGRSRLAEQLLAADNPLVARVAVNRIWHHLFGRGIVPTVDNFGVLGEAPSHPELLDWLADDFRTRQKWSTKRMIRSIVLSNTYRMGSGEQFDGAGDLSTSNNAAGDKAAQLDPQNLLLHHRPVRRLQGEAIRDALLTVSGRLDRQLFGKPVEVHLTPFMDGRGKPAQSGPLDGAGRRSIYTRVRRNFLPPMMVAFDTPTPFSTIGRRSVSNVPAQALVMINDPLVVEQAKLWAARELAIEGSPAQRVTRMVEAAFGRPPSDAELQRALVFIESQAELAGAAADERMKNADAWADFAHVLFNTKEFVFVQ